MATILYRRLDSAGDPLFGGGQSNFVSDLQAVAQAVQTRLKLFTGEWWENINAGTPLFQSMLGVSGAGKHPQAIALLLTQRILATPYVTGVSNVTASYDGPTRAFQFSCNVDTQFGTLTVSNSPLPQAASHLQTHRQQAVLKANFDDGLTGSWAVDGGAALPLTPAVGQAFAICAKVTERNNAETLNWFPVYAGLKLFCSAYFNTAALVSTNAAFGLQFRDENNNVTFSFVADGGIGQAWHWAGGWITCPSGFVEARPFVVVNWTTPIAGQFGLFAQPYVGTSYLAAGSVLPAPDGVTLS